MKKILHNISCIIGFVLLLSGLLLYGLNRFNLLAVQASKLPGVMLILGIGLIVGGACELFIKTSKEMQIEANDERNIAIAKNAKAFAFDIMASLTSIAMVLLILFNVISIGAFFVLFGIYAVSQIAFIWKLWHLQKQM